MYKKIVLNNGLKIVLADMPHMESISIGVWIAAGGRYEREDQAGISHFLEHMVFKGTKNRSGQQIKESIEGIGGALNAFTGEEFTCYLAKVLSKDATVAIDTLTDMALNPKLEAKDFLKERFVILEEIKMYVDMPNQYVHELLVELLWPDHPLGRPLAGTEKTVSSLHQKDLAVYRSAMYNPKNIVIAIAGKLPSHNLIKGIEKIFRHVKTGPKKGFVPVRLQQKKPMTNFHSRNTEQTHIALGFHGYSRFSSDRYTLGLLNIILGGNMSSRLFQEVREELGLAYEISSSARCFYDTGALVVSAGIDTRKISKAIKVIMGVLKRMKHRKVGKEEFRRAKEFYKGQLLMLFEDTMSHMLWAGEKSAYGDKTLRAKDAVRHIDEVTIDDVQRVSRDVFKNDKLSLASVGPIKKKIEEEVKKRLSDL